jgi:hopanoid-associated phosphorylase
LSKTGIVTALRSEMNCLTRSRPDPNIATKINEQLLLVLSGMGSKNVATAIDVLLAAKVEGLVSFGTAGALSDELKSGDIVIPANIVNANDERQDISSTWRDNVIQKLDTCPSVIHYGDIVTTNNVVANSADKQALREKTGAIAVDMESALISSAATVHNLPVIVIRIIVDEADTSIPTNVLDNTDAFGEVAIMGLMGAILRQPSLIKDLINLGSAFKAARHSMEWLGKHAEKLYLAN